MKGQENETQTVVAKLRPWTDVITFNQTQVRLRSSEERLKDSLCGLLTRWVVAEKITLAMVVLKLDVSINVVNKLVAFYGLEKQVADNKAKYKKSSALRNMTIKKSQREQWAYR